MAEAIEMVDIIVGLGIKHDIGRLQFGQRAGIGKTTSGRHIVLKREKQHRGYPKRISIAGDTLENEELIFILRRLLVTDRKTGYPLTLRHEYDRLYFTLELLLRHGRGREQERANQSESYAQKSQSRPESHII